MTEDYLAGLFDGEGAVSLNWNAHNSKYLGLRINLTSTDTVICKKLKVAFGGNVNSNGIPKKGHSKSWRWTMSGKRALALLKQIEPKCIIKKAVIRKAFEWEFLDRSFSRNKPVTEEALKARKKLYLEMKALNKKGA